MCLLTGCISSPFNWGKKTEPPPGPMDSMVLRGSGLEADRSGPDAPVYAELESAKKLYGENDFNGALNLFAKLANNTKIPLPIAEEARFYEAECYRQKGDYRTAEATYKRHLKDFRDSPFTDKANAKLFEIANYWLDDTRTQMEAYEEKRQGKRFFIWPASFVHFSRDKPLFDMEGHAVQALEDVRLHDINGPLGEKALFYLATVKFFREDYREADYYYTHLYQQFPNSPLAPKAIKQAIICKQICTGGTCYDSRTVEEARKLIDTAMRAYPELAAKESGWLQRQIVGINLHQADRDWNIAEFYRRTGKPGSAYFYYELVRRRYPGTTYADRALQRLAEVRGRAETEQVSQQQIEEAALREQEARNAAARNETRQPRRGLLGAWFGNGQKKEDEGPPTTPPPVPGEPVR